MAMNLETAIKFTATLNGQGLDQLKNALQGLARQTDRTTKDLDQLYNASKKISAAAGTSINSLQRQITVMTQLRNEAQIGSRQFKFYTSELERLQKQQSRLDIGGGGQGGLLGALGSLRGSLTGAAALAGTLGATQVVAGIAKASMDAETARVRLKALTDTYGEYNQAQQITARIASTLRISNTEATDSFAKLYAGLRPTGVSLKELEQIFVGFSAAARTSGATAEETSAAMIQLKQALVSGRAQGDELRSILEQAPALGQAVAEQMTKLGTFGKVTRGQLKDLGAEGKISTDVLIAALRQLGEQELPKLNKSFNTGQQALTDLGNATNKLQVALGEAFGPIAVGLIQGFTGVVNKAADAMERLNKFRMDRANEAVAYEQAIRNANKKFFNNEQAGGLINFFRMGYKEYVDQEYQRLLKASEDAAKKGPTADQLKEQQNADKEREASRQAGAMDAAKKRLAEELKIREDMELKLRDFREQSMRRAADLERDLGDQRLQLERSVADARLRLQQQSQDSRLLDQRLAAQAAGLDTSSLDVRQRFNDALRRFDQERLDADRQYSDQKRQLDLKIEDYKISVAEGVSKILQDAGDKLAKKMINGAQAAASALGGAAGGSATPGSVPGGSVGIQSLVALARQAGFRGQDAAIMAAIAMAESSGRSSAHNQNPRTGDNSYGLWQINMLGSMGPFRRRQFGIASNDALFDPATNANAARQVFQSQGFGAWSVYNSGDYRAYLPAAMAAARNGSARALIGQSGGNSSVPGLAGLETQRSAIAALMGSNTGLAKQLSAGELVNASKQSRLDIARDLDAQNKSVTEQLRTTQALTDLQRSGLSPAVAQARVDAEQKATIEYASLQTQREGLTEALRRTDLTKQDRTDLEAEVRAIDERIMKEPQITAQIVAQAQALDQVQKRQQQIRDLSDGIAQSIGGGLSQAFGVLISGTENWGESLRKIASDVLTQIANKLIEITLIQPLTNNLSNGLNGLFSSLFTGTAAAASGGIGSLGFALPALFASGGIMTTDGPLPLRRYAGGGVASSPQLAMFGEGSMPEAYVPLPDGRRIPVAMKSGGGGTTVNVSVDAKGTSVQGDGGRSEQLGRVVAQAVQQELIRQKRPGGILAAA